MRIEPLFDTADPELRAAYEEGARMGVQGVLEYAQRVPVFGPAISNPLVLQRCFEGALGLADGRVGRYIETVGAASLMIDAGVRAQLESRPVLRRLYAAHATLAMTRPWGRFLVRAGRWIDGL